MSIFRMFFIAFFLALPSIVQAGAVITYHGRILDSNKRPVERSNVTFRIGIYSPTPEKCRLYEETRTLNMTDSQGVFVIPIGDGLGKRTARDPDLQIETIFVNNPKISFKAKNGDPLNCNTGSFTASLLSQRLLEVSFDDGSGSGEQNLPPMDINFVPLAVNAYDAQNLGGIPASSVLRVNGGTDPTLTPGQFNDLMSLINEATDLRSLVSGTNTKYERYGQINGTSVPSLSNGQVLGWNGGWKAITPLTSFTELDPSVKQFAKEDLPSCGANTFLQNDGSGKLVCTPITGLNNGTVTSVTAGTGLKTADGNPITSSGTLSVNAGTDVGQVLQFSAKDTLPVLDGSLLKNIKADSLSSTASINTSENITTSGNLSAAQLNTSGDIIAGGSVRTNAVNTRSIYLYDNTTPNPNSIGLQAPNDMAALGGSSYVLTLPEKKGAVGQVLGVEDTNGKLKWVDSSTGSVTSVTASGPLHSSEGSTPNISMPPASTSVDGYLSSTDWNTFNDKQDAGNYVTVLTGDVTASGPGSAAATVTRIQNRSVSATTPVEGQVLLWDSATWTPQFVRMQDIRNAWGGTEMIPATACAANESMVWSSIIDRFKCQTIGNLSASAITGFDAAVDARITLQKSQANGLAILGANSQVPVAQLGSGTASISTVLRGDGTWGAVPSGDLNITGSNFGTQTANTVFAGPASGGSANPSFRSLASDDIPSLTMSKISDAGTAALKNIPATGNAGTDEVVFGTDTRLTDSRVPTDGSVTTAKIVDGSVTAGKLATNSVSTDKVVNGAITTDKILDASVTNNKIMSVEASKITGSVDTTNLPVADGNTSGKESGILSGVAQAIKGVKTFLDNLIVNGNVGIGTINPSAKLDVAGDVKMGNSSAICDGTTEGSQRYNSTSKKMEFCNGTSWTEFGVSGGGVNALRSCDTGNVNDVMVPVGSWCVDKYEASVSSTANGAGTMYFTDSTTSADSEAYVPTGAAHYPAGCNRTGKGCTQFAVSKPNTIPARGMTWYQAAKFCANNGKQMIPDSVWQTAAIGTYDPGAGSGTGGTTGGSATDAAAAQCNINTSLASGWVGWTNTTKGARPTAKAGGTAGGTNACISDYGVEDMVGNLWEWTDMNGVPTGVDAAGFTQGKNNAAGSPFVTADGTWNINGSAFGCDGEGTTKGTCGWKNNVPAAALRGGNWGTGAQSGVHALNLSHSGSHSAWHIGFRCARPR